MNDKKVSINNKLLTYSTGVRGNWLFKASVFNDTQILVVGYNKLNTEYFTRAFKNYDEATAFIEYLTFSQFHNPNMPRWNVKTEN